MEPALLTSPPKSTSLYALVIQLGAASQQVIPDTLNKALHTQVMEWLSLADIQIVDAIRSSQASPFSLSGLMGNRRQRGTQPGDDFTFRICLLNGDLIDPLLQGIEQWGRKPLSLEKCPFVIRSIYTLPGTHPLAEFSNYALLAKKAQVFDDITLKFFSPTSFKQNQVIQPFPLPELVFGSLLRRWNIFAPPELHFSQIEWNAFISAFELKTSALKMENKTEIGAEGWVRYRFLDPEQSRIATILAHFAEFAGVGRKTAMGMGQVITND
ncbi:MAG TPA: CRISPR-associated endoribonuclease Cas6 [Nodularia sp. (in: cyanobacteria)]|nr:CRISPR-associated endoribonuclease Cas6 [Nodularia sp. (in: cyanobacteria)]